MSQLKMLFRLQKLDLEIETRRSRLREITAALQEDTRLRQVRAKVSAIQDQLRSQETNLTDLTLELQTVDTQTQDFSQRLYSGAVSNPKELEELQKKIAERKRRHITLENDLLETMIAVEDLQATLTEVSASLNQAEAEWKAGTQSLSDEQTRLKTEYKNLKAERDSVVSGIQPDHLELYQKLRAQKQGRAVAVLEGEMCSACRVGQTMNIVQKIRQGDEIVLCASCSRILIAL